MSRCRSCHREIIWARTPAGKTMPVDPEPVPDGNVLLVPKGDGYEAQVVVAGADHVRVGVPRHVSHFATCPNAVGHRRR